MACRKDGKGRVLRKGEGYRKGDGRYSYVYIDPLGKKRTIYAKSLVKLREREEQLQKDQLDGLDIYVAGKADVNFLFDRYISTKTELRSTTYSNYLYTWNHFIRDTFGKKKVRDVKYSDVLFFYTDLINNQGLQINTLETINTVLRPTFQLAVRDDIIRKNPVDGAYCEVKKRNGGARKTRRALTVDQQRKFMEYVAKNPFFYHWYPFFVFLLGTGCRIGEAIGIRWDDIDLENRIIDINHSLTYYQRADDSYKCEFRVSLPKTEAGNRRIPMMQQVYDVLQEEYERQKQEGFCVENVDGMTKSDEKYMMVQSGGSHMKVFLKDIVYAEVYNRKVIIHTRDTNIEYYGKLQELSEIAGADFFRTHRAYLVHFKYVQKYDANCVTMENGTALIAKQNYSEFVKQYLKYNQRKGKEIG